MNSAYWRNPYKTGVPVGRVIEVVVEDGNRQQYVVSGIWDGEDWVCPADYKFTDYGYERILYWRPTSSWPGKKKEKEG